MKTEIVCIMDVSGSMEIISKDAIGGFNAFIESQKQVPGEATVTLVLFNHEHMLRYQGVDIKDVKPLDNYTYVPSGTTALLDALGSTINSVGSRLSAMEQCNRPDKVLFCITTDGQENSSHEFISDKVKEMIERQRSVYNWEFIFLAANQDAFATAGSIGIAKNMTRNYTADSGGTRDAYVCMASLADSYRSGDNDKIPKN